MKKKFKVLLSRLLPYYGEFARFQKTDQHSRFIDFVKFKLGLRKQYWPSDPNCLISNVKNVFVGRNCLIGRSGNYIQGAGIVFFGNYVQLAPNVGILSSNHDLYDQKKFNNKPVLINDYCWVGMNCVILPGVELGVRTIVAAGSVVTKSFPEGYCVIAGSPARIVKQLDKDKFIPWDYEIEYYGYIKKDDFENSILYKNYLNQKNELKIYFSQ